MTKFSQLQGLKRITAALYRYRQIVAAILIPLVAGHAIADSTDETFRPGMDVFLYRAEPTAAGIHWTQVKNVSDADGYDNQPSFSPDNQTLLFASARNGQSDIYEYQLASDRLRRLTETPESEYSPMMAADNQSFTAVREGGEPYQSLHRYRYPTVGQTVKKADWAVASQTPIGYYVVVGEVEVVGWSRWADAIYLYKPGATEATFVIGHALPSKPQQIPGTDLVSFVHRQANDEAWIKSLNPKTRSITPLAPLLTGNIDYAWTAQGELISAKGSQLFRWQDSDETWQLWADLKTDQLFEITRLAFSRDSRYMALVAKTRIVNP